MRLPERFRSLAFRLAFIYALLFALGAVVSTVVGHVMVMAQIKRTINNDLLREVDDIPAKLGQDSIVDIERVFAQEAKVMGINDCCYRLLDARGAVLASSDPSGWQRVRFPVLAPEEQRSGAPVFKTVPIPDERRAARILTRQLTPERAIQIAYSMEDQVVFLSHYRRTAILVVSGMLLLGTLIGWHMGRRTASGVKQMTRAARRIAQGGLEERVRIEGNSREIDELARAFNSMAERIQGLLRETKESNDHIAHDLRSPIARIRAVAEASVVSPISHDEHEAVAGSIVEECDRLLLMVNTMLDISEAEAGVLKMTFVEMDVAAMARQCVELFGPAAESRQISLRLDAPAPAVVRGDLQRCQRMLSNVLDNALKYTEPGGAVQVTVRSSGDAVTIAVRDTGAGVDPSELPRIFDRFYRGDRSRHQAGNGLGLSLALSVARAHGGNIEVVSASGQGSTFTITLPVRPPATSPRHRA